MLDRARHRLVCSGPEAAQCSNLKIWEFDFPEVCGLEATCVYLPSHVSYVVERVQPVAMVPYGDACGITFAWVFPPYRLLLTLAAKISSSKK